MALSAVGNNVAFTGNSGRNVEASDVGVAAGGALGGVKYLKRFKQFGKAEDVVQLTAQTTKQIKQAGEAGKQITSLWGKMFQNAKQYKNAIIDWCQQTNVFKTLKPVFESKAFAKVSGVIGGVTAAFVFISGLGEMGETYTKATQQNA